MEKDFKRPPFELDRTRSGTLVEQLSSALWHAIETGYYQAGDMLPPTRDLAEILGVSRVVAIRAVRRLADRRLVRQRPHTGSVVCSKKRPVWKGQVLIIVPPGIGNPGDNSVYAVLRDSLTSNGYLPLMVTVPRHPNGSFDFSLLDTMQRQQADFVVQLHDRDEIARYLSRLKTPFVRFTKGGIVPKNCIGAISKREDLALGDFVEHCSERKVKNVLQVTTMKGGPDATAALRSVGIRAENWTIPPPDGSYNAMGLVQRATDAFTERFVGKGRSVLPDLIFFRDDHLAVGGLLSLMATGIRIPEDVSVVTWANTGLGPAFVKPLTRMEQDNSAIGEKVAECVLEFLRTGVFPPNVIVGPKYIRGETF